MTTLADALRADKAPWSWFIGACLVALLFAALAIPGLNRSRSLSEHNEFAQQRAVADTLSANYFAPAKTKSVTETLLSGYSARTQVSAALVPDASAGRKIIRRSSMELVVKQPTEVADRIIAMTESLGGYLVRSEGLGQNSASAVLTIRVPVASYEQMRTGIRGLGLRVESERAEAQDVTRQYVDLDANLRNLRAEEAQYLAIMKEARTVKDLLTVSEKVSEVRGQIEQQQAEFNALSQQIDTVAITISLRTEAETQVLGLNWRPLYQFKLALRDGLEGLATYATAMTAILLYLPAAVLWVGTILGSLFGGWRLVRWVGRRWFGWKAGAAAAQP